MVTHIPKHISNYALAALCLVASFSLARAVAQAKPHSTPILLRLKFAKDQILRYRMVSDVELPIPATAGSPERSYVLQTASVIRQSVQKLMEHGAAQVATSVERQETQVNGRTQPPSLTPDTITTFDTLGRVIDLHGGQPGSLAQVLRPGSSLGQYIPDRAVAPGDSWDFPFRLEGVSTGGTIKTVFLRYERVGTFQTARLHSVVTMPIHTDTSLLSGSRDAHSSELNGIGTIEVDNDIAPEAGIVVRNTASGTLTLHSVPKPGAVKKNDPFAKGITLHVNLNMSMTLIP